MTVGSVLLEAFNKRRRVAVLVTLVISSLLLRLLGLLSLLSLCGRISDKIYILLGVFGRLVGRLVGRLLGRLLGSFFVLDEDITVGDVGIVDN